MNCRKFLTLQRVIRSNESFHLVNNQTLVGAAEAACCSPSMTEVNSFLHLKKLKQIEIYSVHLKNISMPPSVLKDIPSRNARAGLVFGLVSLLKNSSVIRDCQRGWLELPCGRQSQKLEVLNTNPNADLEVDTDFCRAQVRCELSHVLPGKRKRLFIELSVSTSSYRCFS